MPRRSRHRRHHHYRVNPRWWEREIGGLPVWGALTLFGLIGGFLIVVAVTML